MNKREASLILGLPYVNPRTAGRIALLINDVENEESQVNSYGRSTGN